MRIAITGASGLLGCNLALAWSRAGHAVLALYGRHAVAVPGADCRPADLAATAAVAAQFGTFRPDWVVHAAAMTAVDECERQPELAMQANAGLTRSVACAAAAAGARLLYVSTDSVFDGSRGGWTEADRPAPVNAYARSKLAGEDAARAEASDTLVIRTNLFGWNARSKASLAEFMLAKFRQREAFEGFVDVVFSPLLVNDLGDMFLDLMTRQAAGLLHVGASDAVSKHEFGRLLAEVYGLDASCMRPGQARSFAFVARRPLDTSLAVSRAEALLGRALPKVGDTLRAFRRLEAEGWTQRLKMCSKEVTHE